jgi:two-component SAPR family response regulator
MSPEKAVSNLTTTVSALRKALEPDLEAHKPSAFITAQNKSYQVHLPDDAAVDFLEFKKLLTMARQSMDAKEKAAVYEHASKLYTGDFLGEDQAEEWTFYERERLKEGYLEAEMFLAQLAQNSGKHEVAIIHARNLFRIDRTFEKGYLILFKSQRALGLESDLKKEYAQCRKTFKKELGIEPPQSLQNAAK